MTSHDKIFVFFDLFVDSSSEADQAIKPHVAKVIFRIWPEIAPLAANVFSFYHDVT